jgi:hypothetical protein
MVVVMKQRELAIEYKLELFSLEASLELMQLAEGRKA